MLTWCGRVGRAQAGKMGRPACLVRIHPERCRIGDKKPTKQEVCPAHPGLLDFICGDGAESYIKQRKQRWICSFYYVKMHKKVKIKMKNM